MQQSDGYNPGAPAPTLGDKTPLDLGPYKFSPEEMRVLNECNREAFFKRCLPLGSLLGFGTYYGIRIGYFKGHPKFGSVPKVAAAVCVGYFVGKFSYQWKCAQKMMEVPNSRLGQMLRERRRAGKGGFQETLEPGFGTGISLPSTFSIKDEPLLVDDSQPTSFMGLDDRPYRDIDFQRPPSYDGKSLQ
uniref:OCIA domain-containing protein 1 n=1 Tax=Cacopsylla melanoneura TaxID=428564 RepID=A0A8D9BNB4_9HEMI